MKCRWSSFLICNTSTRPWTHTLRYVPSDCKKHLVWFPLKLTQIQYKSSIDCVIIYIKFSSFSVDLFPDPWFGFPFKLLLLPLTSFPCQTISLLQLRDSLGLPLLWILLSSSSSDLVTMFSLSHFCSCTWQKAALKVDMASQNINKQILTYPPHIIINNPKPKVLFFSDSFHVILDKGEEDSDTQSQNNKLVKINYNSVN